MQSKAASLCLNILLKFTKEKTPSALLQCLNSPTVEVRNSALEFIEKNKTIECINTREIRRKMISMLFEEQDVTCLPKLLKLVQELGNGNLLEDIVNVLKFEKVKSCTMVWELLVKLHESANAYLKAEAIATMGLLLRQVRNFMEVFTFVDL